MTSGGGSSGEGGNGGGGSTGTLSGNGGGACAIDVISSWRAARAVAEARAASSHRHALADGRPAAP